MKECPHCGVIIDDELRYCPKCGMRMDHATHIKTATKKRSAILIGSGVILFSLIIGIGIYRFFATSYLNVNQNQLSFVKGGGTVKLPIDYDGYTWGVSHAPDWVKAFPHADTLFIEVAPNLLGLERNDSIVLRSGTYKVAIPVSQNIDAAYIEVLNPQVTAAASGQAFQVDYITDGAAPQIILPDYCHVTALDPGKITFSIEANNTGTKRTARIQLLEDEVHGEIVVEQPSDTIIEPTSNKSGK